MEDLHLDTNLLNEKTEQIGRIALEHKAPDESQISSDLRAKAKAFLEQYSRMLAIFATNKTGHRLNFVPSLDSITFAFDATSCKVLAPIGWFANEQYSDYELLFANFHEIGHFLDMSENPSAFLENFRIMEREAESLAKKYMAKHPDKSIYEEIKKKYYEEIHGLYNALDDIYVNNLVFQSNNFFGSGDGREGVASLYEKLGFGDADLTNLPLHRQFIMSLLRDEMLGETHGKSIVDERVSEVLSRPVFGQVNMRAFINAHLKPHQGIKVNPNDRYGWIRDLIEPKFLDLLELAHEEQEKKQQGKEQGDKGKGEFDPFGDNNSRLNKTSILDHGEYNEKDKEILDAFKEAAEKGWKYDQEKAIEKFDHNKDISKSERENYEKIASKIRGASEKMHRFWDTLIGESIEFRRTEIKDQYRGDLDMRRAIKRYSSIQKGMMTGNLDTLKIYKRAGSEWIKVNQPEEIDVSLLVDCSGSMNDSKIEAARKTTALLMLSISDFNRKLRSKVVQRSTNTELRARTEVIRFGDAFETIKHFSGKNSEVEIIKSISKIDGTLGSTYDDLPLQHILDSLSDKDRRRIKDNRLKRIVFEITDGASLHKQATSDAISALAKNGVIMIGFQIGIVNRDERDIFNEIWNSKKSDKKFGVYIGENVSKLPGELMNTLKNSLNDIVI